VSLIQICRDPCFGIWPRAYVMLNWLRGETGEVSESGRISQLTSRAQSHPNNSAAVYNKIADIVLATTIFLI